MAAIRSLPPALATGQTSLSDASSSYVTDDQIAAAEHYFSSVASPPHRRDLKLALTVPIRECLTQLLTAVGPALSAILTEDALLCELSARRETGGLRQPPSPKIAHLPPVSRCQCQCGAQVKLLQTTRRSGVRPWLWALCSFPGAAAQALHPDTQIVGRALTLVHISAQPQSFCHCFVTGIHPHNSFQKTANVEKKIVDECKALGVGAHAHAQLCTVFVALQAGPATRPLFGST